MPRCILAEFNTHRMLSRNAASSRAIPIEKLIEQVVSDPFIPLVWGTNQRGMQAVAVHEDSLQCERAWLSSRDEAVRSVQALSGLGLHKQIVNRIIEPWMWTTVVASSTNWSNFLALRDHPDAEPHIQMLAREIRKVLDGAVVQTLQPGEWHLPFVTSEDWNCFSQDDGEYGAGYSYEQVIEDLKKVSAARCASTSYKTVDGFDMTIERAIALVDKLIGASPLHASPFEHVAQADEAIVHTCDTLAGHVYIGVEYGNPHQHGNFKGFRQWRKQLLGECQ
jgi:hypothetical protein